MGEYGTYAGHIDPTSLSGAQTGTITIGSGGEITFQAYLYSHKSGTLHYRILTSSTTASALATSSAGIMHMCTDVIKLAPVHGIIYYLHWILVDVDGAIDTAGALDYLSIRAQRV